MKTANNKIFGLDFVRTIAISLVVISHSIEIFLPLNKVPIIGYFIGKLIALTFSFGVWGVELFFALSGFLIGTILIREFILKDARNTSLLHFWKMRWMRTLPAYYTVLTIVFLLNYFVFLCPTDISFILFLQNFNSPHPDTFGEAWSLSIEEWTYIFLPILFLFASYTVQKKRKLLMFIITYILIFVAVRLVNAWDPIYQNLDKGIRKVVLFRMDAIVWGVLVAYFHIFYTEKIKKLSKSLFIIGIISIGIISVLHYLGTHPQFNFYNKNSTFRFLMNAFLYTLYPALFAITLPFTIYLKAPKNSYIKEIVTKVSRLSYCIYLTHNYIILQLMTKFFVVKKPIDSILFFIVYIILLLISAIVLHRLVELPFLKRREKIRFVS